MFPLKPATLFGRAAFTFTLAFLIFSTFSLGMFVHFVAMPLTKRSADDLSALIVLASQIWVELPPGTRPDFEREMLERHNLVIGLAGDPLPLHEEKHFYLRFLQDALAARTGKQFDLYLDNKVPDRGWLDIPIAGRTLRVGFSEAQLISGIPVTMIFMVLAGTLIAVITSLLMMRRITLPLARLASATTRIGLGQSGEPLEEQGASELVELTRNFNQMENQLKVLMENRTTLLAGISHDLRTPIARMQLELEMINCPSEADREMLEGLRQNLDEMNQIITATLQLSKGLGDQVVESVDLLGLLDELVAEFRSRGALIQWRDRQAGKCALAVNAFRRVVSNLLENAWRYGGGRPVYLRCSKTEELIRIEVIDQGKGIPKADRERVFQPFTRLDESRSRAFGGSGLGLAIVAQLCSVNGWSIELSESEFGGVKVILKVGCADASDASDA